MDFDPIREKLKSYDSSVSEDVIKHILCTNLRLTDPSLLDDVFMSISVNSGLKAGWIAAKETIEEVRRYLSKFATGQTQKVSKVTPLKTPTKSTPSKFASDFSARKTKGNIDASLGDSSKMFARKRLTNVRVDENPNNLKQINNFYCEPLKQRREAMVKRIQYMASKYKSYFEEMQVHNFNRFSNLNDHLSKESVIFCVGRIVHGEGDGFGENNTRFEDYDVSQRKSTLCTLDLSTAKNVQCIDGQLVETSSEMLFFPSQIVAIEGNYDKESSTLVCNRVFTDNFNDSALMLKKNDDAFDDVRHFSLMSASGPFFFNDTLDFTLLNELVERIKEEEPNIVILTGPFVDIKNESVKTGNLTFQTAQGQEITYDYEELFEMIVNKLENDLKNIEDLKVYILPSTNDAHHPYPLPQPPFNIKNKIVKMLSNPAQLTIRSDVRVAVISNDFLIDMMKTSYHHAPSSNKLVLGLKETLNQRLMNPVYPSSIMLDTTLYDKMTYEEIPNIVIYPSILASTIKVVKDTIFVNHGTVFKQGGGTYAKIIISTEQKKKMEERTCVEIKRI